MCGIQVTDKVLLNFVGCNFIKGDYRVKAIVTFEKEKRYFFFEAQYVNEFILSAELNMPNLFEKEELEEGL